MGLLAAGPSAPSELASRLGLTTGAMTKVLDRLERAGCVTRSADSADRRRITITADPDGLARVAAPDAPMGDRMSEILAGYSGEQLETVLGFIRAGQHAADEEIARIREHGIPHATRRSRQPERTPSS